MISSMLSTTNVGDYIFEIDEHFVDENCELKKYIVAVESRHT
jgi:hypothetical protein